ncbi:glycoside hydrolase [Coprinopsis sp. MPI-PUGE-AT-0042]|nr:glycoside hydrolase [Coprinopsis sp. MPI-PUGE-AT-0042]
MCASETLSIGQFHPEAPMRAHAQALRMKAGSSAGKVPVLLALVRRSAGLESADLYKRVKARREILVLEVYFWISRSTIYPPTHELSQTNKMPSTLPTYRRNPLDALVAHYSSPSSSHFGRTILHWLALSTILIAGPWFLSPLIVDTGHSNSHGERRKRRTRKQKVKNAFARAYVGYRNHAYPRDELLPTSGGGIEKINGWSLTAVEALSTMWLMDVKTEFWRTVQMLERKTSTNHTGDYIPFFETTIRHLGVYLFAYTFAGEKLLLTLADDIVADRITQGMQPLPAIKTMSGLPAGNVMAVTCMGSSFCFSLHPSESRPPLHLLFLPPPFRLVLTSRRPSSHLFYSSIHRSSANSSRIRGEIHPGAGVLAEIESCQLEFKYLAKETGWAEYYERVNPSFLSLKYALASDMYIAVFDNALLPYTSCFQCTASLGIADTYLQAEGVMQTLQVVIARMPSPYSNDGCNLHGSTERK